MAVRGVVLIAALIAALAPQAAAEPLVGGASLVTPIPSVGAGSDGYASVVFNGRLLFGARDPEHGHELWHSDGTAGGTALLSDLVPGPRDASPTAFTVAGGKVFFTADRGLWVTDGTAAGAQKIATVNVSSVLGERPLIAAGSRVFFNGSTETHGQELWTSDGTPAGTKMLADLCPGTCGQPQGITAFGSGVLFAGNGGAATGLELYASDGNTVTLVKDIAPGTSSSVPRGLVAFDNKVWFSANDGSGTKLWTSDGTPGGTVLGPTVGGAVAASPENFTVAGTRLYFTANLSGSGRELCSAAIASAPTLVEEITAGAGSTTFAEDFGAVGNNVYFAVSGTPPAVWVSDGTAVGTLKLTDVADEGPGSVRIGAAAAVGGQVLFSALSADKGFEPFRTDGTPAGTGVLRDINPGLASSEPSAPAVLGGAGYFFADDGLNGHELWRSDGTPGGTVLLKDINGGFEGVWPDSITPFGSGVVFSARGLAGGYEPWASDGTAAGTNALGELQPGPAPSGYDGPRDYVPIAGGAMVFAGTGAAQGEELWRLDPGGAVSLVRDINVGAADAVIRDLVSTNGLAFFVAKSSNGKFALWRSDGTFGGTSVVDDLGGNDTSGSSVQPTVLGTFVVYRRSGTGELWRTNGTAAENVKIGNGPANDIAVSGDTVWYVTNTRKLFKATSTPGSEVQVADLPGTSSVDQLEATPTGLFIALGIFETKWRYELWHSNGTAAGTQGLSLLADDGSRWNWELTFVGGQLYFQGSDAQHGLEPWVSDGTSAGTHPLADLTPGADGGGAGSFSGHLGRVFFRAYDETAQASHLWQSDGTAAGTARAAAVQVDGDPGLVSVGKRLFFSGGDPYNGRQLWVWQPAEPSGGGSGPGAGGGGTGGGGGVPLAVLSRLKLSPTAFLAARSGASVVAAKTRTGTIVSYRLSAAATVRFTVRRVSNGRRSGKRCVKPTTKNRKARSCKRLVPVRGSFSRKRAAAGADRFRFTGRLAGKRLRHGRYKLTATPISAGKKGKPAVAAFTVKRAVTKKKGR